MTVELATLGGGCFWCTEAIFLRVRGVKEVTPGYAGGHVPNPSYEQVCSGTTGHAEVVQISFDPKTISYKQLLDVFFEIHDPTSLNRQGNDVGEQYRSIILYHDEEQRRIALETIREVQGRYTKPVVTQVVPFTSFYPAEEYHRRYYEKNRNALYCRVVITPKVRKLLEHFPTLAVGMG
ncbi:peptide methionine sulfoxide reductase MsrA [Sulfodiicoccus acidiphilus]|uniref:Peptide methionine sulfoxide reductase MsrA n=1 Tax=Sulfodiicoccus acidiphilus TaxID=1670455 RepID=A0A348B653_9CREN|nr:peptide-methionine (S)-S-oxide reductase MsrA [Sulfodiicoccus acidiphilus]BBD73655.1 peptide methionine sulfoxide reductase MsrA [Sulfodiicoccus acidiphilus]GGU02016.1 peptide methionine sulfoxide reductase MsrA [Sulfodiicoccus acidiphilus]